MKSFTATTALLALISATSAASTSNLRFAKRNIPNGSCGGDPGQVGVANAINAWNADVQTVNAFLEQAPSLDSTSILFDIENVLTSAQDEPNQLTILACNEGVVPGTPGQTAADDLFAGFENNVLVPLGNIIQSPADADNVATQLHTINQFRCCSVLPDLDALWEQTAADEGLVGTVPISAPRPSTCASITC
ncbi:hypothetical protein PV04_05850 [Phialophora macrospora]|uniref:Uncharacterized protein n=1 Tax=Phialophora macrospora TaxID=1851006 RepID=A0A0D2DWQ6_9EURO|nr:hypothetical protein PV04_05850 [Phialophora macrospora]